jgi:ring-1,2-phenylacetyl-CoA epoxidase subunit PaaE
MQFYPLTISNIHHETMDTIVVSLQIPIQFEHKFKFISGQYLTFKVNINGEEVRRSYSICSAPYEKNNEIKVAIKRIEQGLFSNYAFKNFKKGDIIETMTPSGNFTLALHPTHHKHYVAIALGSGITPIISILKSTLAIEENSIFTLIYGNRNAENIIFKTELQALKNTYNSRLEIIHIFSKDKAENILYEGRLDEQKFNSILHHFPLVANAHEYLICGPENVIKMVNETLQKRGKHKENIRYELFTTSINEEEIVKTATDIISEVIVIIDDEETRLKLSSKGENILDAALKAGADAPFACKGAVCCTCKAKVLEGKVHMDLNHALTEKEVEQGYVLTCQSHPISEKVVLEY